MGGFKILYYEMSFEILFFLFSSIILTSALVVISARNPIHSVLFLILVFVNVIFKSRRVRQGKINNHYDYILFFDYINVEILHHQWFSLRKIF